MTLQERAQALILELEQLYGGKLLNGKAPCPLSLIFDTCECLREGILGIPPNGEPQHRSW